MRIRVATDADLAALLELMRGYYRDDGLRFDAEQSRATLLRLLQEPQWGRVWLAELDSIAVGYVALCLGFSLQFGGNDAFIDEIFVLPEQRGRGYGRALMEFAGAAACDLGVTAVHLEVDRGNESARHLYSSLGYREPDRYLLMTLRR
jgi:diamine N-acetyltransferase